jgi:DNA mismatch repair protein MutS
MIIDDYVNYQNIYKKKYGKCIVLYQNGSFYEIYNVDENDNELAKVCELLNIQHTRKNKSILQISKSNPALAGVPLASLKKYLNVLLSNNYTVVLVEQITEPPNPKRDVTNIYSPSTYIDNINIAYSNVIVSLYISQEYCMKNYKNVFIYSLCNIDISTGKCSVYSSNNYIYDKSAMFDDIFRYIETNNCKELIITTYNIDKFNREELLQNINANNRIIHNNFNLMNSKYFSIAYINEFLGNIYGINNFLSPIEYLNFEKNLEIAYSFIILLNFCYEHNHNIIQKLKIPTFYEYNDHLILYNNSIYQLDIIEYNKYNDNNCNYKSLFSIINKCSTNIGKRLLNYNILNPLSDVAKINIRYDQIEYLLNFGKLDDLDKLLKNIVDIERMHRKITLKLLQPHEYFTLTYSYKNILKLLYLLDKDCYDLFSISDNLIVEYNNYIFYYESIFDMDELGKCGLNNINNSFFKSGIYSEIDIIQYEINNIKNYFDITSKFLSNLIEENSDFVKLEYNDRDGYFLYTTKNRCDNMLKKIGLSEKSKYEIKKYNGNNVKIVSVELIEKSNKLIDLESNMQKILTKKYIEFLTYIDEKYSKLFNEIINFIGIIDVAKSGALVSLIYNYSRPIIDDKYNGESYFSAVDIRHPIIEVVNQKFDYVKNDIELLKGEYEKSSMLIYGLNSAGKSSLIKAVCLNIVLCQMGYYTSSTKFTYYPYNKMFVRISCDDNLYKNLSSNAVEITELSSILQYADSRSIVISDELCKGTETMSGISICASSLIYLTKKNINYLNTTHYHELYEIETIKNLKKLSIKHINVSYDEKSENIIYNRKLVDGIPPNKYYGLEFASFLIKNSDFMKCAFEIRSNLLKKDHEIISNKTSNYNSELYINKCVICGNDGSEYPLDTHHIKFQKFFNKYDFHKNKLSNLVVLCKDHHNEVHNDNLIINGYVDSIKGKILDYEINSEKEVIKRKKYNEKDILLMKDLALKFNNNNKNIINELKNNYEINISSKTLNLILKDEY